MCMSCGCIVYKFWSYVYELWLYMYELWLYMYDFWLYISLSIYIYALPLYVPLMFPEFTLDVPCLFPACSLNFPKVFDLVDSRLVLSTLVLGTYAGNLYSTSTLVLFAVGMGAHGRPLNSY
jgi:hypothetical protein